MQFKLVMYLVSAAFTFVTGAVVLQGLAGRAALAVGIALLLVFVAWSFAITYTVSARVFGAGRAAERARSTSSL